MYVGIMYVCLFVLRTERLGPLLLSISIFVACDCAAGGLLLWVINVFVAFSTLGAVRGSVLCQESVSV